MVFPLLLLLSQTPTNTVGVTLLSPASIAAPVDIVGNTSKVSTKLDALATPIDAIVMCSDAHQVIVPRFTTAGKKITGTRSKAYRVGSHFTAHYHIDRSDYVWHGKRVIQHVPILLAIE